MITVSNACTLFIHDRTLVLEFHVSTTELLFLKLVLRMDG
jgi:hypothetical protein